MAFDEARSSGAPKLKTALSVSDGAAATLAKLLAAAPSLDALRAAASPLVEGGDSAVAKGLAKISSQAEADGALAEARAVIDAFFSSADGADGDAPQLWQMAAHTMSSAPP
eukprot:3360560-Prymnesium_polylepis.1